VSTKSVLVLHDDDRWWPGEVLDQYRDRVDGSWRVVVTYSTGPGLRYIRAEPADRCRPADKPPLGWSDARQVGRTRSAQTVTASGAATGADQPPR
jgi:hypothetical protein